MSASTGPWSGCPATQWRSACSEGSRAVWAGRRLGAGVTDIGLLRPVGGSGAMARVLGAGSGQGDVSPYEAFSEAVAGRGLLLLRDRLLWGGGVFGQLAGEH